MPRGDLYPEIGPCEPGYLPLSANHVMYWEQVGNPRGRPVLFLHGGPGAGAGAVHRRFFDPEFWRLVIFHHRGAGRSRPLRAPPPVLPAGILAAGHLRPAWRGPLKAARQPRPEHAPGPAPGHRTPSPE